MRAKEQNVKCFSQYRERTYTRAIEDKIEMDMVFLQPLFHVEYFFQS